MSACAASSDNVLCSECAKAKFEAAFARQVRLRTTRCTRKETDEEMSNIFFPGIKENEYDY